MKLQISRVDAGINLRGLSAAAIGKRAIFQMAFGSTADAAKEASCIRYLKNSVKKVLHYTECALYYVCLGTQARQ